MTDLQFGWVAGFFEAKGSFCRTGRKGIFALEAFSRHKEQIEMLADITGGHVIPPPPSAPTRWAWRLYGAEARDLYSRLRPHLSDQNVIRGDRKLEMCV